MTSNRKTNYSSTTALFPAYCEFFSSSYSYVLETCYELSTSFCCKLPIPPWLVYNLRASPIVVGSAFGNEKWSPSKMLMQIQAKLPLNFPLGWSIICWSHELQPVIPHTRPVHLWWLIFWGLRPQLLIFQTRPVHLQLVIFLESQTSTSWFSNSIRFTWN